MLIINFIAFRTMLNDKWWMKQNDRNENGEKGKCGGCKARGEKICGETADEKSFDVSD
jgi:hypothetical protein